MWFGFQSRQHFSTPEIHRRLIQLYGDDVMRVQRDARMVQVENGRQGHPQWRSQRSAGQASGGTDFGNKTNHNSLHCTEIRKWIWLFVNGSDCKTLKSRPQNSETLVKVGQLHKCALGDTLVSNNHTSAEINELRLRLYCLLIWLLWHRQHYTLKTFRIGLRKTPELSDRSITEPQMLYIIQYISTDPVGVRFVGRKTNGSHRRHLPETTSSLQSQTQRLVTSGKWLLSKWHKLSFNDPSAFRRQTKIRTELSH